MECEYIPENLAGEFNRLKSESNDKLEIRSRLPLLIILRTEFIA